MIPGRRLKLLGEFELTADGSTVPLGCAAQRVVAYLALQRRSRSRVLTAATLWPSASEERARGNLRSTLWRLRVPCARVVVSDDARLALATNVAVDVDELVADASATITGIPEPGPSRLLALDGELLPDWFDDWVLIERERLRQLRLHALEASARQRVRDGRFAEAYELAAAALAADPLRESAHRVLVELHLAEGNRVEALRQYALCRRLLSDRLGLEPSAEMRQVIAPVTAASFLPLAAART